MADISVMSSITSCIWVQKVNLYFPFPNLCKVYVVFSRYLSNTRSTPLWLEISLMSSYDISSAQSEKHEIFLQAIYFAYMSGEISLVIAESLSEYTFTLHF